MVRDRYLPLTQCLRQVCLLISFDLVFNVQTPAYRFPVVLSPRWPNKDKVMHVV